MKETQESTLQKRFRFQRDLDLLDHPAESYLLRNEQGYNCIHLAAAFGGIDALPTEILTSENLGNPNENGDTPLHLAAKSGRIYQLLDINTFLTQIDWEQWKSYWNRTDITGLEDFGNYPIFKFEILVPEEIATSFFLDQ
jgi:ankyrin repeat protein